MQKGKGLRIWFFPPNLHKLGNQTPPRLPSLKSGVNQSRCGEPFHSYNGRAHWTMVWNRQGDVEAPQGKFESLTIEASNIVRN